MVPPVLKKSRSVLTSTCTLTFSLPSSTLDGPVSVVGTFNDWTPGAHPLRRRSNGTVSTSVKVPVGTTVRFRYLGEHGRWFDDADADEITVDGSVVLV
ncbi:isoamylase [Cellulomonas biazotea]|uniref:Isoamylase n=1 Tax=Cellulomonas biazotea TaxID=1709 RepID=A0A402DSG2_9CELL|nr:isoamylase [Cellulomonas biazotea]